MEVCSRIDSKSNPLTCQDIFDIYEVINKWHNDNDLPLIHKTSYWIIYLFMARFRKYSSIIYITSTEAIHYIIV